MDDLKSEGLSPGCDVEQEGPPSFILIQDRTFTNGVRQLVVIIGCLTDEVNMRNISKCVTTI